MTKTIGDLPIGTLVKDVNSTFLGVPVIWKISDKNHTGYPTNSVTLITEKCIALRAFDAKEPNNSNLNRKTYGNNRYSVSNIRQWLNSDAKAGQWYSAQHSTDQAPNSSNVYQRNGVAINPYDTNVGFLNGFSKHFKDGLLETTLTVALNTETDGGGSENVTDKIFLASKTEVGFENENNIVEGSLLSIFSNNVSRITCVTAEAITDSNYSNDPANDTTAWGWWLRTPYSSSAYGVVRTSNSGVSYSTSAYSSYYGVRPLCNVMNTIQISDKPDANGVYTIIEPTQDVYIGVDNIARKVKAMYVGVDGVARKVKKGYIGVNGVARQFYSSEKVIPFTTSIIPTGWVASTGADQYTSESKSTNKYGIWTASLIGTKDAYVTGPNDVINATTYFVGGLFNNQDADAIYLKLRGLSSALSYVELVLPNNIYIKPSAIYLVANTYTKLFVILGFNPETNTWETLLGDDTGTNTLWYTGSSADSTTKNISTSNFYSKFRFGFSRYNSSRTYAQPTMIKITSGELKIE